MCVCAEPTERNQFAAIPTRRVNRRERERSCSCPDIFPPYIPLAILLESSTWSTNSTGDRELLVADGKVGRTLNKLSFPSYLSPLSAILILNRPQGRDLHVTPTKHTARRPCNAKPCLYWPVLSLHRSVVERPRAAAASNPAYRLTSWDP